jgi:predicted RNA-binding protein with PUA-like domain
MEATRWLLKSEPHKYSFADLVRDGTTVWDGVRNNQAALYLKAMRVGQQAIIYHSGTDKAAVGVAKITREAFLDPTDPDGRFVAVEIAPEHALERPVMLAELKAQLPGMVMFRQFRLSVSPVTQAEWNRILEMAAAG